jgi:hypothetical protein
MDRQKSKFTLPEPALSPSDLRRGGGGRIAAAGTGVEWELLNAVRRRGAGHNGRSCTKSRESCHRLRALDTGTFQTATRKSAKITTVPSVFCNAALSLQNGERIPVTEFKRYCRDSEWSD